MRLIHTFKEEKEAAGFQQFLQSKGIGSLFDFDQNDSVYHLWVMEEEFFNKARDLYEEWKENPTTPLPYLKLKSELLSPSIRIKAYYPPFSSNVTRMVIFLCALLFILNGFQKKRIEKTRGVVAAQVGFTPIQQEFFFDYPDYLVKLEDFLSDYPIKDTEDARELPLEAQLRLKKIEMTPTWKGFANLLVTQSWKNYENLPRKTLFGKIRQGELWRLVTPVFLHANFFHILFNMAWLLMLGKQIEFRIGAFRFIVLSLAIGIFSNIAQYLVSGPIFVGYSGIIVGMVGFIWMRKKIAPKEGYPLQRSVIFYIGIFILAMLGIELILSSLELFHLIQQSTSIANTAHVAGGLSGIALARIPFFNRIER